MLFPWPVHLRRFRLSQQHEHAKTRYLYAKFSRFTRFAFQKKRERRNEKTTRIANSVWGVFRQLLNHIKYQLTASIPHYFVDVWSVRRLSLFNVFKSIYSLPLFVQLKFYSQKTGSVKNNWQNRNNRSKGRQTFLLRRHRLQGLQLIRLHKNNDGFVVLWQLFLPHHEYGDLANFVVLFILAVMLWERSPTRPKRRSKPYMEKRWFIPRKPFKKLIGLHSKRFRVSLELKELAQDLAGCDDCAICHWLPLFFSPSF